MFRYNTLDPELMASSGVSISGTINVGDKLAIIQNYILSLGSLTRWREVTDSEPTPEDIRSYASSYTPGSSTGSWMDQHITFYLSDDGGELLDPKRYRLFRIHKMNQTSTSNSYRQLVLTVYEVVGGSTNYNINGPTGSSISNPEYYIAPNITVRLNLMETDEMLMFVSRSSNGADIESYYILTYKNPLPNSLVSREDVNFPGITLSYANNQNRTSSGAPGLSYITAASNVNAYISPTAPVISSFNSDNKAFITKPYLGRSGVDGYYLGEFDDIYCTAEGLKGTNHTYEINGRRYIRANEYNRGTGSEASLILLFPVE